MCKFCVDNTHSIEGLNMTDSLRLYSMINYMIEEQKSTIINSDNSVIACFFQKLMKQNIIRL